MSALMRALGAIIRRIAGAEVARAGFGGSRDPAEPQDATRRVRIAGRTYAR
jgi:hypothetical protein